MKRVLQDKYERLSAQIWAAEFRRNEAVPIPAERPTLLTDFVRLLLDQYRYDIDGSCKLAIISNPDEFRARHAQPDRPTLRMAN